MEKKCLSEKFWEKIYLIIAVFICCSCGGDLQPTPPKDAIFYPEKKLDLAQYKLISGPIVISCYHDNVSSLTYNPNTNCLYTIDQSGLLAEIELDGTVKRTIQTSGFRDVEGIVYIDKNTYYLAEERRGVLCKIEITDTTTSIVYDAKNIIKVDDITDRNQGLEGLCFDHANKRFFSVKEKSLPQVYQIDMDATFDHSSAKVKVLWNAPQMGLKMSDFSGVYYHQNLLIVSDESDCVVEVQLNGRKVSQMLLGSGQAEGIAMDKDNNLYICSEPNLLYIFSNKKE